MDENNYDEHNETRDGFPPPRKRIRFPQNELLVYRELTSTNIAAREMAAAGAPAGTVVTSAFQNAGAGRLRRAWISPPGRSLLFSVILRPRMDARLASLLTLLCGAALSETIRETTSCEAGVKWPNDVLMRGRKVSGILAQGSLRGNAVSYVVLGVGLNVNQTDDELPPECRDISTSLRLETGGRVSRAAVLRRFLSHWSELFDAFSRDGYPYLREKWIANNLTLGREITIRGDEGAVMGTAVDISERGGIVVRFEDGSTKEFLAEDLSLGREHYRALTT
jgi:BirA family biotin operon repressor/biotin-[acetyl-CoA-carboxylase] ligase